MSQVCSCFVQTLRDRQLFVSWVSKTHVLHVRWPWAAKHNNTGLKTFKEQNTSTDNQKTVFQKVQRGFMKHSNSLKPQHTSCLYLSRQIKAKINKRTFLESAAIIYSQIKPQISSLWIKILQKNQQPATQHKVKYWNINKY